MGAVLGIPQAGFCKVVSTKRVPLMEGRKVVPQGVSTNVVPQGLSTNVRQGGSSKVCPPSGVLKEGFPKWSSHMGHLRR
jgi:hypothetical protein